jgi:hypothetical protein
MAALIGAPVSQPSSNSQTAAPAPGTEPPAAEADEAEAVEAQAPPAERPEAEAAHVVEVQSSAAGLPAAGAENLPEAEAAQVVEVQPLPVELPVEAGEVLLEAEREHAPLDGSAEPWPEPGRRLTEVDEPVAPFVSPWLWSTVEEEATAMPIASPNVLPGPSPRAESALRGGISTSPQPSRAGAPAHGDAAPPGDLEDGDGRWEGGLPQDPPGAWA